MSAAQTSARPLPAELAQAESIASLLEAARTDSGKRFMDFVEAGPVLLVFLRHGGCTFCREAISDIARDRAEIEAEGTRIVLVHMGDRDAIGAAVARYGVGDLERICDPSRKLYDAFGLKSGSVGQLAGFKVIWRGLWAGLVKGHGLSSPKADSTQMPGVFLIDSGVIVGRFRHRSAADRPSYINLAQWKGSSPVKGEHGPTGSKGGSLP
jgi:peroxiredoxin